MTLANIPIDILYWFEMV